LNLKGHKARPFIKVKKSWPVLKYFITDKEESRLAVEVSHHDSKTNRPAATPWLYSLPHTFHAKQRGQISLGHCIPIHPSGQPQIGHLSMTAHTAFSALLIALH